MSSVSSVYVCVFIMHTHIDTYIHMHIFMYTYIQVMICIMALGKKCWTVDGYTGPCLGPPDGETGKLSKARI